MVELVVVGVEQHLSLEPVLQLQLQEVSQAHPLPHLSDVHLHARIFKRNRKKNIYFINHHSQSFSNEEKKNCKHSQLPQPLHGIFDFRFLFNLISQETLLFFNVIRLATERFLNTFSARSQYLYGKHAMIKRRK